MTESLRDPVLFPNWVWVLGAALVLISLVWGGGLLVAYRRSRVVPPVTLHSLGEIMQRRYERLMGQIETEFLGGQMSAREAHLAISAVIRAAASERLRVNAESVSVAVAKADFGRWPLFAEALAWCERPSFALNTDMGADNPDARRAVENGLAYARQVVKQ